MRITSRIYLMVPSLFKNTFHEDPINSFFHIKLLTVRETNRQTDRHRRSQDFVWGALFPPKNWRLFFCSSPSKDDLKLLNEPLPHPKNVVKLTLVLPGVCWCALTNFPCKLRQKNFLSPGMHVHPLHPLSTPMQADKRQVLHNILGRYIKRLKAVQLIAKEPAIGIPRIRIDWCGDATIYRYLASPLPEMHIHHIMPVNERDCRGSLSGKQTGYMPAKA